MRAHKLHKYIRGVVARGISHVESMETGDRTIASEFHLDVCNSIFKGVDNLLPGMSKFYLGDVSNIAQVSDNQIIPQALNLPDDNCYVEFEVELPNDGVYIVAAILSQDIKLDMGNDVKFSMNLFISRRNGGENAWGFSSIAAILALNNDSVPILAFFDLKTKKQVSSSSEEALFAGSMIGKVISFLHLISCSNIESKEIVQMPAALRKKKLDRGEIPIYSYHVLDLNQRRTISSDATLSEEEKHKKRLHFRRGHIRRLSNERLTWVRHCMVGDASLGKVDKHYSVGA